VGASGARLSARPARSVVRGAVRAALSDLAPGERVLVALSGGPDSLALLAATVRVAADEGLLCSAVVVDHGLQADSAQIAAHAVEQARLLECSDAHVVRVEVSRGPGRGGPEASARRARYRALEAEAEEGNRRRRASAVLLGHTLEDQAETVLLGLARGSGLRSLAGMAAVNGLYRRPLLEVPRHVVRAAAQQEADQDARLTPWVDPHNEDVRFARARVRATLLPHLEAALGPGVTTGLVRTAALARQDAQALDGWADAVWNALRAGGAIRLAEDDPGPDGSTEQLGALAVAALARSHSASSGSATSSGSPAPPGVDPVPAAIQMRIIRRLLMAAGCPSGALTSQHVQAVTALLVGPEHNSAVIALPAGRQARREGSHIRVRV
jgi:tRNA(Ile)-lysidine synthase